MHAARAGVFPDGLHGVEKFARHVGADCPIAPLDDVRRCAYSRAGGVGKAARGVLDPPDLVLPVAARVAYSGCQSPLVGVNDSLAERRHEGVNGPPGRARDVRYVLPVRQVVAEGQQRDEVVARYALVAQKLAVRALVEVGHVVPACHMSPARLDVVRQLLECVFVGDHALAGDQPFDDVGVVACQFGVAPHPQA